MVEYDIFLQIGTGAVGGAIAGLVAPPILTAIRDWRRRQERSKQIKVVRDHILNEFTLLAGIEKNPRPELDVYKDVFRHDFAPDAWDRLQNTVDHLTGSLNTEERAGLYSALRFLRHNQRHVAAGTRVLSVESLRGLYQVVAYTIGPAFDLPANPQWGSSPQARTASETKG